MLCSIVLLLEVLVWVYTLEVVLSLWNRISIGYCGLYGIGSLVKVAHGELEKRGGGSYVISCARRALSRA